MRRSTGESALLAAAKLSALFLAIFSVILYAEAYNSPWHYFLWITITLGYFIWFSDILETHMDLKRLRMELRAQMKANDKKIKEKK